jgi:hypothetical protein
MMQRETAGHTFAIIKNREVRKPLFCEKFEGRADGDESASCGLLPARLSATLGVGELCERADG